MIIFHFKHASFKNIKFPRGNYQTDSSVTKTLLSLLFTTNFPVAACIKTENNNYFNFFIKISNHYGTLRCFVFSVVPLQMIFSCVNNFICQLLTSKEETIKTGNLES